MRGCSDQRADQTSGAASGAAAVSVVILTSVGEAVARTIKGRNRIEIGVDLAEFAAQALDVAVDRAVVDIDVVLIGRIHQLIAAAHDARAARERFRSGEGRVGKEGVSTCRSRWSP